MSLAERKNVGKPKLSFILEARNALEGVARVLEFGSKKYSRGNWRKGLKFTEQVDSLSRHLAAFTAGEDNDPETNLPHVYHILCNALFLAEHWTTHPELDDRVKFKELWNDNALKKHYELVYHTTEHGVPIDPGE